MIEIIFRGGDIQLGDWAVIDQVTGDDTGWVYRGGDVHDQIPMQAYWARHGTLDGYRHHDGALAVAP